MINKLTVFERKVMRKIFGPTSSQDGYWRIKTNQEINDILKGKNIIGLGYNSLLTITNSTLIHRVDL